MRTFSPNARLPETLRRQFIDIVEFKGTVYGFESEADYQHPDLPEAFRKFFVQRAANLAAAAAAPPPVNLEVEVRTLRERVAALEAALTKGAP